MEKAHAWLAKAQARLVLRSGAGACLAWLALAGLGWLAFLRISVGFGLSLGWLWLGFGWILLLAFIYHDFGWIGLIWFDFSWIWIDFGWIWLGFGLIRLPRTS